LAKGDSAAQRAVVPETHVVRLEPLLLNHSYCVPRWKKWTKLEACAKRTGIAFQTPISKTDAKFLYENSVLLNSALRLSLRARLKDEIRDAVSAFHATRHHFERNVMVNRGSVVNALLRFIAINLRFAKTKLRLAGTSVLNRPTLSGTWR
jgi:hypothetical protein